MTGQPAPIGFQRHSVTGVVGHLDDLGAAGSRGIRRVLATLRQSPFGPGGEEVWHQLIFDDEEAERIIGLRVAAGDLIMVEIARLRAKAYIIHEGETARPFPYIESLASSALKLRRAGEGAADPAGRGEPGLYEPGRGEPGGVEPDGREPDFDEPGGQPDGREPDLDEPGGQSAGAGDRGPIDGQEPS
jgi:hypothetical protein